MAKTIKWKSELVFTPNQQKIYDSTARFKYVKAGRRFGKTKFGVRWQIERSITCPGVPHWYITPTQRMAHEIAWDEYIEQLGDLQGGLIKRASERELQIELVNGSKIFLKGSDKIDASLRGRKLGSVVLDEAAFHRSHIFNEIVRPMLADLRAPALFITSPKRSWFSNEWNKASRGQSEDSAAWHFTIYDNPYMSREEIAQIRASTPEDIWQQEYLANELDYCGRVYNEFGADNIFAPADKFQGHMKETCVMGVDWGLFDPTGVAWLHFLPSGICIVSMEHVKNNWDIAKHAEIIKQRSKGRKIEPGNMVLDASAFRREGSSGSSVSEGFKKEGIVLQKADREFDAGVALMKHYIRGNGQGPWMYFSGMCKEAISAANDWEHGDHEPDVLAAIRYALSHAVRRRISTLSDLGNVTRISTPEVSKIGCLPLHKPLKRWSFDFESGVPCE